MGYDLAGSLGLALIVAGLIVRWLGRSRGGEMRDAGDRLSLVVTLAGVALTAISIYQASR